MLVLRQGTTLARYHVATGEELWSTDVSAWVTGPGDLWGDRLDDSRAVLTTSDGGALLDPEDGRLLWRTSGHLTIVDDRFFEIDWGAERISRLDDLGLPVWTVEGAGHLSWFDGDPLVT